MKILMVFVLSFLLVSSAFALTVYTPDGQTFVVINDDRSIARDIDMKFIYSQMKTYDSPYWHMVYNMAQSSLEQYKKTHGMW